MTTAGNHPHHSPGTLADAGDAGSAALSHHITDPLAEGTLLVVCLLACSADLLCSMRALDRQTAGAQVWMSPESRYGRPGAYARTLSRSRSIGRLEDCPSEPAECGGTARGADAAPSLQHAAMRPAGCRAGRTGGSPCLEQAIWSPQDRPILRVRTMSPCAPSGQVLLAVLRQTSRPRQECAGVGSVFKHAPMRMASTLAVTWGGGDDEAECYSSSVRSRRWMRRGIPCAGGQGGLLPRISTGRNGQRGQMAD